MINKEELEEEEETFTTIYCYKKRVFDNKLVLIGEIFCSSETIGSWYYAPWNPKIVGQETSTKNEYYPNFYNVEGNPLIVDSHAYEVQLYTEPVKDINNLPYTTGTIDTETSNINGGIYMTYWDNYVDNRVIEICYQSSELYKELEKLRGGC